MYYLATKYICPQSVPVWKTWSRRQNWTRSRSVRNYIFQKLHNEGSQVRSSDEGTGSVLSPLPLSCGRSEWVRSGLSDDDGEVTLARSLCNPTTNNWTQDGVINHVVVVVVWWWCGGSKLWQTESHIREGRSPPPPTSPGGPEVGGPWSLVSLSLSLSLMVSLRPACSGCSPAPCAPVSLQSELSRWWDVMGGTSSLWAGQSVQHTESNYYQIEAQTKWMSSRAGKCPPLIIINRTAREYRDKVRRKDRGLRWGFVTPASSTELPGPMQPWLWIILKR